MEVHLLDIIDAVSLAGSRLKPNEDAYGLARNRAWVIDGATGLGDPIVSTTSDAAWVAHRANELFARHAAIADTAVMMESVAADLEYAFLRERRREPEARWEIPCASFMMLSAIDGRTCELAWLGDCRVILVGANGELQAFGATPASEAKEADQVPVGIKDLAERLRSQDALAQLRAGRARYNTPEFAAILAPDASFAPRVKRARIELNAPAHALLMTDGFAALELRFRDIGASAFIPAALESGLARLALRLRTIEEEVDPEAVRFSRWKRSDDATAALVAIG
ncbi:protein phosphatase 2C domain-containing protein [Terrarubrum flagellatum]|uniref:protein phosphatase 2C domain-containing protein n=1 Tax=Terrirubrum flagellatum TaxID=2895980 RepID=UPI003144FCB8